MKVWIKFQGWFQCRLAVDPDPTDEPRGVDGDARAIAGEPDLDRIIRLQAHDTIQRSYCPVPCVEVVAVYVNGRHMINHPLLGGSVELLDSPKFEARSKILAEPGRGAVFPLHLRIGKATCVIQRKFDNEMKFPPLTSDDRDKFRKLQATGININPGIVGEATGIFDLAAVWKDRIIKLQKDIRRTTDEIEIAALKSRIALMSNLNYAKFFSALTLHSMPLTGSLIFENPDLFFPGSSAPAINEPWHLEFWCGGWDTDALCAYMVGFLEFTI